MRHLDTSPMPHRPDRDTSAVIDIGSALVEIKMRDSQSNVGFSLIEYEIPARTLAAPLHRHTWEDEFSFVLEGRMGAILGAEVIYAGVGELVFKPRRLSHTVWNPDDAPCRVLEIISPGGFEHFFEELADQVRLPSDDSPDRGERDLAADRGADRGERDLAARGELAARYGVQSDLLSVQPLCARHGLDSPLLQAPSRRSA